VILNLCDYLGEEPLRHKQLVLKRNKRSECTEAIVDIVVYRSKDTPAHNFRKLAWVITS